MLYQITIEEVYEVDGKDYPKKVEIYKQQVPNLNVCKLVTAINETAPVGSLKYPDTGFNAPQYTTGVVPL